MQRLRLGQTNVTGAAELRDRVVFEQRGAADDGAGNIINGAWAPAFPAVAAGVTPLLGGESVMQARLASRQPVIIKVRYSSQTIGITTDMRARSEHTGAIYEIKSVADTEGTKRFVDVLCEDLGERIEVIPAPPPGYAYLLGADGEYLKGADGKYLLGEA